MLWAAFTGIAFLCGSIPFSVWLGKLFLRQDVRQYGDGNPGAANVFRAGNQTVGLFVLILDVAKAALPVGLAYHTFGIRGFPIFLIAMAPVIGHAFSPFLGFQGGKAIAAALGVWIGLTIWKAPLAGVAATLVGIALASSSGWAVVCGLAAILATLLIWDPDRIFLWVWASQTLLLVWKHRADLRQKPRLRSWVTRLLARPGNERR